MKCIFIKNTKIRKKTFGKLTFVNEQFIEYKI